MARAWNIVQGDGYLLVRFGEHVSELEGRDSAERLVALVGDRPFELRLDVTETRGYESGARKAWQGTLWPRRGQITGLVVASRSAVPKMGASMFAAFLGISCRHVDSFDE